MIITIFLFFIFTIVGFVLLRTITKEGRFFTLLPAGMIASPVVYIFLLNWNSKIFHGQLGIILSTIELILLSLFLYKKYRRSWVSLESARPSFKIFYLYFVILIIFLSFLKMTTMFPAADSSMQWAYAASFARGNYPLMASWQPDLNPNYHLGAYFLEGALHSLSGLQFLTIHTIFSIYILIAGSLLAIFFLWKKKYSYKNIWLILAGLILFISYGVIIIFYPNFSIHSQTIINFNNIDQLIGSILTKQEGGAPLVSLSILALLPARSLSLCFTLLALYFTYISFKNDKLQILAFTLLLSITALVEESMFLPLFGTVVIVFILSFFSFIPKLDYLKSQRKNLFFIVLFTFILVMFQGGITTESLFTHKDPIFRLVAPFQDRSFFGSITYFKNITLDATPLWGMVNWFIPSPLYFILILLVYSYLTEKPLFGLMGIFSAVSFAAFLIIIPIYCEACNTRFNSLGNIAAGVGIILLLFEGLKHFSMRRNILVLFILIPILFIPSLLPDLIKQSKGISDGLKDNFANVIFTPQSTSPQNMSSDWANKNLPINARVIVMDREFPSPSGSLNFQYHGLYTTLGPQYIHVNRQEPGIEFFDLALTLNPSILKQTKTGYIYIESESEAYKQLPQFRKEDLSNKKYFEILQSIDVKGSKGEDIFYRLYKVNPEFIDSSMGGQEIEDETLATLQKLIPENVSIYIADYGEIPKLNFWYRMAIVLALKDRDISRNLSQTDYQIIETRITYKQGSMEKEYDYYILAPDQKPPFPSTLIWSNIFATAWGRDP